MIKSLVDPPNLLLMGELAMHPDIHSAESLVLPLGSYAGGLESRTDGRTGCRALLDPLRLERARGERWGGARFFWEAVADDRPLALAVRVDEPECERLDEMGTVAGSDRDRRR